MCKRESGDESTHNLDHKRPHYIVTYTGNCDLYNFLYIAESTAIITRATVFLIVFLRREKR